MGLDAKWEPGLYRALMDRNVARLHQGVESATGRCQPETYLVTQTDQETYDVGIGLRLGRWHFGRRSLREFSFTTTEDRLADQRRSGFSMSRGRMRSRLRSTDFWQVELNGAPTGDDAEAADTYDKLTYSIELLWQTDLETDTSGGSIGRRLKFEDVGLAVDFLALVLGGGLPQKRDEPTFVDDIMTTLEKLDAATPDSEDHWLGNEGLAAVEITFPETSATDFAKKAQKIASLTEDKKTLASLCLQAMSWEADLHRRSFAVREEVFQEFFRLLVKDPSGQKAKNHLNKVGPRELPADLKKALKDELKSDIGSRKRHKRPGRRKYDKRIPDHPITIASDFAATQRALKTTAKAFQQLAESIEQKKQIEKKEVAALQNQLFALARTGTLYDYRLLLLLLREAVSKPETNVQLISNATSAPRALPIYSA